MIRRIACHCEAMINVDDTREDESGWLYYEAETDNGLRKFGLCTRCQGAIKCYLDNNPIKSVVINNTSSEEPKRKRGRPSKSKT